MDISRSVDPITTKTFPIMDISHSHSNNPCSSFMVYFFLLLFHLLLLASSCSGNGNVSDKCIETERKALVYFKEGLIDPLGRLSSWVGLDCCRWQGVECNNRTAHVTELDLHSYSLSGKIKPSLLHLKHLSHLSFMGNSFCGNEIPKFFGMLKNLKVLNLSYSILCRRDSISSRELISLGVS